MPTFYEFFAGGGMVRAGLGSNWKCLFANDFDSKKALTYQRNWGCGGELNVGDIRSVKVSALPDTADLMWGSFPCQDLSLAGGGAGLKGERSGTFFPFWNIVDKLVAANRAPRIIAIENVLGTLTSHGGKDFNAICRAFARSGYKFGPLVINASLFVPQSRPRLFIIGVREAMCADAPMLAREAVEPFHTNGLQEAVRSLPHATREKAVWWNVPTPPYRNVAFVDIIERKLEQAQWHTAAETKKLLSMMSLANLAKVEAAMRADRLMVGCVYKRTRVEEGCKVQRAEVRFDDIAGCLRTPAGGSSRQTVLIVEGERTRSRLLTARETARLMGLDDRYKLPSSYNEAYHLTGDGVAVPVVRHLAYHVFEPLLAQVGGKKRRLAA